MVKNTPPILVRGCLHVKFSSSSRNFDFLTSEVIWRSHPIWRSRWGKNYTSLKGFYWKSWHFSKLTHHPTNVENCDMVWLTMLHPTKHMQPILYLTISSVGSKRDGVNRIFWTWMSSLCPRLCNRTYTVLLLLRSVT